MKPTNVQIEAAHKWFDPQFLRDMRQQRAITADMLEILLTTTAPPPHDERPDDMAELARLVAKELRKRGIWAWANNGFVNVGRGHFAPYAMVWSDFDNLTPRECADVIQAEEAKKATEWAGDVS